MDGPKKDKKCPVCTKKYASLSTAEKHIRRKHPQCTEPPVILSQAALAMLSSQVPIEAPKPVGKKRICGQCPDKPVFKTKAARKKHAEAMHATKQLQEAHGIVNGVGLVTNRTVPQFTSDSAPAESAHATSSYQTSGVMEEPSYRISVPPQDGRNSIAPGTHSTPPARFYCQEYDCGRGFSSKVYLESHTKVFHPQKPKKTAEGVKEATTVSNDTLDADERSARDSPAYFSPTSTVSSHLGESATEGNSGHVETHVPALQLDEYQGAKLDAGKDVQQTDESLPEPPTTIQGGAHVTQKVTASTPLSMQCRMCNAPPTVGTRPTVTTCGHLFCSECITQHVMSTSRCPVCDNALLLYCLFKLDLSVSS